MNKINDIIPNRKLALAETSFDLLMKKRINKVLLICSSYDAFMLEEDGRIDEQIFNEYVSLNLRYPPQFVQVSTSDKAFAVLNTEHIDLVITMLSIDDMDPFELAVKIKNANPEIPIVVLTPFSREVSIQLTKESTNFIDYVFSWLGNSDILLAIIKLIEDKMNAELDVHEIGVQVIILVEDSIRFYSSYLANIYKIIFIQSKSFMTEGLNEHQKMLRMRGRPKILLATNYEEAISLYKTYKKHLLGIISDISYEREGNIDELAGVRLCEMVKSEDKFLPFLLQSSNIENEKYAKKLRAGFINKNSKTLSLELRDYIVEHFAFGDFIFRDPCSNDEIGRAADLQEFQQRIFEIPDESLSYHINRNHISKWLNARALFPIAEMFKYLRPEHFENIDDIRCFIYDSIADFRKNKGRGVIAKFYRERFDKYLIFSRIGEGSIGGKARGLAFIDAIIKKHKLIEKFDHTYISIPRTVVICTDIFDEFMEDNNLYNIALSNASDNEILEKFINARLPFRMHEDLIAFVSVISNPIAVRSSSLLEDSHYQPFAGIYSTYMLPKVDDERKMIEQLSFAIKCVYASVYFKGSKSYMAATKNVIDEEKMAIVLQEVCGHHNGEVFYPTISGVARSINFYPIAPEAPQDGIANIAYGLGKYIVDGGVTLRFSPKYPKKLIQLSSVKMALRDTQNYFYGLDTRFDSFKPSTDEKVNLIKIKIQDVKDDDSFKYVVSTFDMENNMLRDGFGHKGRKVVTFSNILNYKLFPLAEILQTLLSIGQMEMNNPIEIEFAINLNVTKGKPVDFSVLQIRPIVDNRNKIQANINKVDKSETIIFSNSALGNGELKGIRDIIYVKPEIFNPATTPLIADRIEKLNTLFREENRNYVLIGPGRWGSSDPWLGIPVKWAQISCARVIIESGLSNFRIDPSQGTHFFQNLTSFQVGYFTINPFINDGFYDLEFLNETPAFFEDEFIRCVRFNSSINIQIDGVKNQGVIYKPGNGNIS